MGRGRGTAEGPRGTGVVVVGLLLVGVLSWWLGSDGPSAAGPSPDVAEVPRIEALAPPPVGAPATEERIAPLLEPSRDAGAGAVDTLAGVGAVEPTAPIEERHQLPAVRLGDDGCSVSARVIDTRGRPVRAARVEVEPLLVRPMWNHSVSWGPDGELRGGAHAEPATTDDRGRFTLRAWAPDAEWNDRVLKVTAAGHPETWVRLSPYGEGEIVLPPGVPLRGRILWREGGPVAGLGLDVFFDGLRGGPDDQHLHGQPEVTTDDEGRFALMLPPDVGALRLQGGSAAGRLAVDVPLDAWRADPAGFLFVHRIAAGLELEVRLLGDRARLDPFGPNAQLVVERVEAAEALPDPGDAGRRFRPVPEQKRQVILAELAAGEAAVFDDLPARLIGQTLRVVLRAPPARDAWSTAPAPEVEVVPPFVGVAGRTTFAVPIPDPPEPGPPDGERPAWPIDVRLVDDDGRPLDAEAVRQVLRPIPWPRFKVQGGPVLVAGPLDPDTGTSRIWTAAEPPLTLTQAVGSGQLTAVVDEAAVERDDRGRPVRGTADFTLTPADHARLTATVRFDFAPAPVDPRRDRVTVALIDDDKARHELVGTDVVRGLVPGRWIWEVTGDGLGRRRGEVELAAGTATRVAVETSAPREATIRGTVLSDGVPPAGPVTVLLRPRRGHRNLDFEMRATVRGGTFQLDGVPPGSWALTARSSPTAARREAVTEVTVADGDLLDVALDLEPAPLGVLYVNVRRGGAPLDPGEAVAVELWRPGGMLEVARTMSIPERQRHSGQPFQVPLGEYVLRVELPDGRSRARHVEVTEAIAANQLIQLTPREIDAHEVLVGFPDAATGETEDDVGG